MMTVDLTRPHAPSRLSPLDAARRHRTVVLVLLLVGLGLGWRVGDSQPTTWSSTARVLINPTVGNPFAPAPSSVRQDELTSLETEAQVAGSAEVLEAVAAANPPLTVGQIQRGLSITVPPNTQVLALTYAADDARTAEQVVDSWARLYLDNRDRRAEQVNVDRIEKVEKQTEGVVADLRVATAAAQRGTAAERQFQSELAAALRNQLVSLRAQRSYLENSEAPAGSVIAPASAAARSGALVPPAMAAGGAVLGLALGVAIALLRERVSGRVRAARDVVAAGIPVLVASHRTRRHPFRTHDSESAEDVARRVRAEVLHRTPTPEVVAVAPAAPGGHGEAVAATLATALARAGHRVVLVSDQGAGSAPDQDGRGLAHVLLHERTRVGELLHPSLEPALTLLPWGFDETSRDRLSARSLRSVLAPLVDAGHVVVLAAPEATSVEGEAVLGAADLGLVVVTVGRTPTRSVAAVASRLDTLTTVVAAVVVDARIADAPGDLAAVPEADPDGRAVLGPGDRRPAARSPR